jgi:hypothetical protein
METKEKIEEPTQVRDLFSSFIEEAKSMTQYDKINAIYTSIVGKKPAPQDDLDKKLVRIIYEQKFGKEIKQTEEVLKGKKQFKWPFKWKSAVKKAQKAPVDYLLVMYLSIKGKIEMPKLYPLYSGNMVIIRNKPYEVDPRAFWDMGKVKCLIIKEIDRRPVSNLDYDAIRARGDATDSDEFLIKAAMKAFTQQQAKKPINKTIIIVVAVIIIGAIIYLMSQ